VTLRPSDWSAARCRSAPPPAPSPSAVPAASWPGPGGDQQDAEYLSPADWAVKQIDERLELLASNQDAQPFTHAAE
jgi:hypothetical protein